MRVFVRFLQYRNTLLNICFEQQLIISFPFGIHEDYRIIGAAYNTGISTIPVIIRRIEVRCVPIGINDCLGSHCSNIESGNVSK